MPNLSTDEPNRSPQNSFSSGISTIPCRQLGEQRVRLRLAVRGYHDVHAVPDDHLLAGRLQGIAVHERYTAHGKGNVSDHLFPVARESLMLFGV